MTIAMQPIYTQTVGSGGATSITFNNIPQTFTDLKVSFSARATASVVDNVVVTFFNGDQSAIYSNRLLYGTGSGAASGGYSNNTGTVVSICTGASATANTFGNADIYIPNYTGANFKSGISDSVSETNATAALSYLNAILYRSTNAITSMTIYPYGANFTQYSTFTLYGITKG